MTPTVLQLWPFGHINAFKYFLKSLPLTANTHRIIAELEENKLFEQYRKAGKDTRGIKVLIDFKKSIEKGNLNDDSVQLIDLYGFPKLKDFLRAYDVDSWRIKILLTSA